MVSYQETGETKLWSPMKKQVILTDGLLEETGETNLWSPMKKQARLTYGLL